MYRMSFFRPGPFSRSDSRPEYTRMYIAKDRIGAFLFVMNVSSLPVIWHKLSESVVVLHIAAVSVRIIPIGCRYGSLWSSRSPVQRVIRYVVLNSWVPFAETANEVRLPPILYV